MFFQLFVGLEAVSASHISFVSPSNATSCGSCVGTPPKRSCESQLANAPLISLVANVDCSNPCVDWNAVVPQSVEPIDSAFEWDTNNTVIDIAWGANQTFPCGNGYYLFGFRNKCGNAPDQLFCKRAKNLNVGWGSGGTVVVTNNTLRTAGATFACPNSTYLVGLAAGVQAKYVGSQLVCAFPPDTECLDPPDQNTTYTTSPECSSSLHQFCVVTLSCKPYFQKLNGSESAECRPSAQLKGAYNTSLLQCVDIDECALNTSYCGVNGVCINQIGAPPLCSCQRGFAGPGCSNVNECTSECFPGTIDPIGQQCHNCASASDCTDTQGGFNCTQVTNPCLVSCNATITTGCNNCSALSTNCSFSNPSYTCTCPPGYFTTDGGITCQDTDECLLSPCSLVTSTCLNLNGSFACLCLPGYEQTNSSSCSPINECLNTSICPIASQCVDTTPFYYCLPWIVDVQKGGLPTPFTLSSTQALSDVISLTVLQETSCIRTNSVFYGGTRQFSTSLCNVTTINATSYRLECLMSAGAGANLSFSLQCCPNSTFPVPQPCRFIPAPAFVFSYPPPTLTPNTLTYDGSLDPNGTAIVDVVSQSGLVLTMQGANLFPLETSVYFGTQSQPLLAPCTLVGVDFSTIQCKPQMLAGENYTFTAVVGVGANAQQSEPGTDFLTFTGDPPVLEGLLGCTPDQNRGVKDCPTQGGVTLTVFAKSAKNASLVNPQLMINGNKCLWEEVVAEGFSCTLPPGTGLAVPMELTAESGVWEGSMLSYAPPQITRISSDSCASSVPLNLENCSLPLVLSIEGINFGASGAVVMLDQFAILAVHVAHFPGQSPSGPDGEHRFLLANVTSLSAVVSAVVVNQLNGRASGQPVSLSLARCPFGYGRVATSCAMCAMGQYEFEESCLSCHEGSYQPLLGQTACLTCPLGSVQASPGANGCSACGPGTYPNAAQSACLSCSPGKFNPSTGGTQCTDCAAGTYQSSSAASTCISCDPGQYSIANAAQCGDCPPGRVAQQNGTTVCASCPPGTYQDSSKQSVCKDCFAGYFTPSPGFASCLKCTLGSFQNETRQTSCKSCEVGRAQPQPGATICSPCQPGKTASTMGSHNCRDCPVGTYSNATGSSTCDLCPLGSAQKLSGFSSCKTCVAGSYSDERGRHDCEACQPGSFQNSSGASFCFLCDAGSYSPSRNSLKCIACEPGTFQAGTGQPRCMTCGSGLFQPAAGAIDCSPCSAGTAVNKGSSQCTTCPIGTFSEDKAPLCLPCTNNSIQPYAGQSSCIRCPAMSTTDDRRARCLCDVGTYFFVDEAGNARCDPCPPGSGPCAQTGQVFASITTIPGWWRRDKNSTAFMRCNLPALCIGNDNCESHRQGPLCALCEPGYKFSGPGSDCSACPPTRALAWAATVGIVALLIVLLLVMYTVALRLANAQQARLFECVLLKEQLAKERLALALKQDDTYFTDLRAEIHGSLNGEPDFEIDEDIDARAKEVLTRRSVTEAKLILARRQTSRRAPNFMYKVKILIGFFQIASYLPSQGDIQWPYAFREFITAFSLFNFDFIPWQSLGCATNLDYFTKTVVVGFVPICAVFVLVVFFAIGVLLSDTSSLENQMEKGQRRSGYMRQFLRLLLFTVFLLYPLVSKSAIGIYNCITVEGVHHLAADFALHCYDSTWTTYAVIDGFFVLIYPVGIPIAYLVVLHRHRPLMREPETILKLGFLYEAYTSDAWYWELIDMIHKLILTSVVVFSPSLQRMAWNMGVMGFYLILLTLKMPYIRKGDDRFHKQVQATLFCVAFVGYLLQGDRPYHTPFASPAVMEGLIAALLIIMVLVLLLSFIFMTGRNIQKILNSRRRAKKMYLPPPMQPWNPFSPAISSTESDSKSSKDNSSNSKTTSVSAPATTGSTNTASTGSTLTGSQRSSGTVASNGSGLVRLSATPAITAVAF